MTSRQYPLALPVDPAFTEEDFLVTGSNERAVHMLAHWADPGSLLLLGPQGTGKTHLAHIWHKKNNAAMIDLAVFDPSLPLPAHGILEDADMIPWDSALEKKAFHLLNAVKEQGTRLLVTASVPPLQWPLSLADLRSRLLAMPVAQMEAPDDRLMAGLLLKLFRDRQIPVSEDVLNYLIARLPRDGAAIAETVRQLDAAALSDNRAITIPLAKKILET